MATNERVGKDLLTAGLGHPETFLLESQGSGIFVKMPEDGGAVEVFDRKTGGLITKCALNGSAEYHAPVLDETDHRLFTFSRHPSLMEALSTFTGKEGARFPVVGDPDDALFDKVGRRTYVTQGFIKLVQEQDADNSDDRKYPPGARTSYLLIFGKRARFYVAEPRRISLHEF